MAIQIIPQKIENGSLWLNILFYFSIILAITAVSGYFILFSLRQSAEKKIDIITKDLVQLQTPEGAKSEQEITNVRKKISDFSALISSHLHSSGAFALLERTAHPKVYFKEFSLSAKNNSVSLSGSADNLKIVSQQLLIFRKEDLIREVKLSDVAFNEGGKVSFSFNLVLDPKVIGDGGASALSSVPENFIQTDENE